ncbi:Hydrogenase expression/formation protein hupH (C-terminal conserved region) [Magnetospira sp. QH-2]|nr:Hydrogenase expression/formation protein hupH (C-terminal conserved region) [Magnetospira sp. QH-2]
MSGRVSGAVEAILNQLSGDLERLVKDGIQTAIDLRTLPLTDPEIIQLIAFLGEGEVSATVNAQGRSDVRETVYPGLWLVTHFDGSERQQGQLIEVTDIPEILKTQRADALAGQQALSKRLATD